MTALTIGASAVCLVGALMVLFANPAFSRGYFSAALVCVLAGGGTVLGCALTVLYRSS